MTEEHLINNESSLPNNPNIDGAFINAPSLPNNPNIMDLVDALLKNPCVLYQLIQRNELHNSLFKLLSIFLICVIVYGLIVGSFSGNLQLIAAPIKIILGIWLVGLLCFPSLYILSALSGVNLTIQQLAELLITSLTLISILLLGFAPIAFIFTFSIKAISFMGIIHLLILLSSLYFGLRYFIQGIINLGGNNDLMIKIWGAIFLITLLQMSTTLRPILGNGEKIFIVEKKFFLEHWAESFND